MERLPAWTRPPTYFKKGVAMRLYYSSTLAFFLLISLTGAIVAAPSCNEIPGLIAGAMDDEGDSDDADEPGDVDDPDEMEDNDGSQSGGNEHIPMNETIPLKEAKLIIEHNATDEDTGFQGFIDSEGWRQLDVTGP